MKLTREGKRFLLATALIAFAAVNTGNNLIYLILSLMFSFIALSYGILKMNLAGLRLEILASGSVFAGVPAHAELLIHNRKKIPAYSLNLSAPDVVENIYCSYVPSRGTLKKDMFIVFSKRGLYRYRNFFIQSGFPFILFQKSIAAEVSGELLVYPQLLDIEGLIDNITAHEDQGEKAVRDSGDDVYALREYQYGDDRRDVHWKASARRSILIVKEYAGYLSRRVTIILDNGMPRHDEQHFEKAVAVAASLTTHYIAGGYLVRLLSCRKVVPFGSGQGHLFNILDILALIREEECAEDSLIFSPEGFSIIVVRSAHSSPALQAGAEGMVVYADTV